jgi:hypothetical protein
MQDLSLPLWALQQSTSQPSTKQAMGSQRNKKNDMLEAQRVASHVQISVWLFTPEEQKRKVNNLRNLNYKKRFVNFSSR